jgi:hypothetical protein
MKKTLYRLAVLFLISGLMLSAWCGGGGEDDPTISNDIKLLLPQKDAKDVPLNVELKWELKNTPPAGTMYEYDVYLDTNDPPAAKVGTHITVPSSFWPTVSSGTTYYWKVVGIDYNSNNIIESVTWKFTTVQQ